MLFKKNLNYLTSTCGKSIKEVADDLNIGYETYRTYLRISQPKYEVLIAIAQYFHITVDDLLMRDIENEGHLETNKNEVVNAGAASVYLTSEKVPNLNLIIANLVHSEVQPLQLQLEEFRDTIDKFVILLEIEQKMEEIKNRAVSSKV